METNANLSPVVTHQPSLLGGAEMAQTVMLGFAALTLQSLSDNQRDARRRADNAAAFDHLVNMTSATAGQTGDTENQQAVTPIRTGAGDDIAAGSTPANRITDTSGAVSASALDQVTAKLADALVAAVTRAAGAAAGASGQ